MVEEIQSGIEPSNQNIDTSRKEPKQEGDHFTYLNSLRISLEKKYFLEFNSSFCNISLKIPRVHDYNFNVDNEASFMLGIEDQGKSSEKKLCIIHRDITVSFSLNPSLCVMKFFLGELEMLLVAYTSHVSIFEKLCAISLDGNLFLLVPCTLKRLTPCVSLENQLVPNVFKYLSSNTSSVNHLLPSKVKLGLLSFEHENLHDHSFMEPKVIESWLACAIFDVFHARTKGKPIENNDYVLSFFATFMKNIDGFILSNQPLSLLSDQIEFLSIKQVFMKDFIVFATANQLVSCLSEHIEFPLHEHELSHVVESLKTLFENAHGFQFYNSHFKKFILKNDFENKMRLLVLPQTFQRVDLEECISLALSWKNSCALFLKYEFGATLLYRLHFKESLKKIVFKEECRQFWTLKALYLHLLISILMLWNSRSIKFIL
ncbi:hypothetical protein M9H77_03440 [Catharanthus roseus]|uniref:Uncharacterized protein n=1 Tax=Catharanthus roseus TaxID=4058 RepID=A0ACC0CBI9_CATRO|nr:hypothetical protein M9H77_03440 [Catharanthus roseus]